MILTQIFGHWTCATPAEPRPLLGLRPDVPGHTRVFYSVNVMLKGWMREFIVDMMQKSALTQVCVCVRVCGGVGG